MQVEYSANTKITLAHFNDVYNIEPGAREPVGGASRLKGVINKLEAEGKKPVVTFGGDAYNPSLMSTVTRGKQMVGVLSAIGVQVACVGNHDLDFGVENMRHLNHECGFPWLMANVIAKHDGKPLGEAREYFIMEHEGKKIGFFGVVEEEWIATLGTVNPTDVIFKDFVEEGRRLAKHLREMGCDLVVAMTHSRVPNDVKICEELPEIDLMLGGHDHHYEVRQIAPHGTWMVKAGSDFKWVTEISIEFPADGGKPVIDCTQHEVTSDIPEDPAVAAIVEEYMGLLGASMDVVVGFSDTDLDGRFTSVRTWETNLGNLVCDVWRGWCDSLGGADLCLLNSGSLRSDQIHPRGEVLVKDLVAILPMLDETCIIACPAQALIDALENSVCMWPKLEGRFPQVSGIKFTFDGTKEPMKRVDHASIFINGEPIDMSKTYRVATKTYLAAGKDGFTSFADCEMLTPDVELCPLLPTCLRNHFLRLEVLSKLSEVRKMHATKAAGAKWASNVKAKRSLVDMDATTPEIKDVNADYHGVSANANTSICTYSFDFNTMCVAPKIEGRIVNTAPVSDR